MSLSEELKRKLILHADAISSYNAAAVLRIPQRALESKHVYIADVNNEYDFILVLYHYRVDLIENLKNEYSESEYLSICQIRGVIVLADEGRVVCKSYPCTSTIPMDQIPTEDEFQIDDYIENPPPFVRHLFNQPKKFNRYIVGAVLRLFCVRDVIFVSTHKKISFDKSKFGSDKSFGEMFFAAQSCFDNERDLPKTPNVVHAFIISSESLNVDSRVGVGADMIYYISSFRIEDNMSRLDPESELDMTIRIQQLNKTAERKIQFPTSLTYEEVNQVLNPSGSPMGKSFFGTSRERFERTKLTDANTNAWRYFQNGEKIAMRTPDGINTLIPSSALRRSSFVNGKLEPKQIFCDCIGFYINGRLSEEKIFIDVGFPIETLRRMADEIYEGYRVNFWRDKIPSSTIFEKILTNLVFSVPIDRMHNVLRLPSEYHTDMRNAFNFIMLRKDQIRNAICEKQFERTFPGISKKKTIVNYFKAKFVSCFNFEPGKKGTPFDIIGLGPESWWPSDLRTQFEYNQTKYMNNGRVRINTKTRKIDEKVRTFITTNAIMCFVLNAEDINHYTILNFKKYVVAAEEAFKKSAERKNASLKQPSEDEIFNEEVE